MVKAHYPHFTEWLKAQISWLAHCQGLEFSLTELEMDFHCKEFQLRDLTKLPCSFTCLFNGVTHHCNVWAHYSVTQTPGARDGLQTTTSIFHVHRVPILIITSSITFELWRLLTPIHPPWHVSKEGRENQIKPSKKIKQVPTATNLPKKGRTESQDGNFRGEEALKNTATKLLAQAGNIVSSSSTYN